MRMVFRSILGASVIALTVGLVLATRTAQAQAPAPGPVPSVAPPVTSPPASVTNPSLPPRGYVYSNPRRRVYTVPSQGTASTRRRLHYGYFPARREVPLYKPWLKPD
jgi:hypothetical protein